MTDVFRIVRRSQEIRERSVWIWSEVRQGPRRRTGQGNAGPCWPRGVKAGNLPLGASCASRLPLVAPPLCYHARMAGFAPWRRVLTLQSRPGGTHIQGRRLVKLKIAAGGPALWRNCGGPYVRQASPSRPPSYFLVDQHVPFSPLGQKPRLQFEIIERRQSAAVRSLSISYRPFKAYRVFLRF